MRKTPYIGISRKDAPQGKTYSFQMRFLEVKAIEDGKKIRIKGFASTPEVDRYDDIVNPGAFANAMVKYMTNPVVLLGHNPDKVLGQVIEYNLSAQGLEVTAELNNDIENTFHNIMEKNLRGFSIGYRCLAANYKEEGNREIREITELDLVEISVVSTPANPGSLFTMAKSFKLALGEMELKKSESCDDDEDEEGKKKKTEKSTEGEEKEGDGENKEGEQEGKEGEGDGGEPPKTEPKTGEEGGGENPPPAADDSGEGKTAIVEGDEKPEDKPQGMTEEQVKALIDEAVKAAVEPLATKNGELEGEIKNLKDALAKKDEEQKAFQEKYGEHFREFKRLEEDFLSIEVRPGGSVARPRQESKGMRVTDAMILANLGM